MDRRVLALYRKAAGTDNAHERDAFLAKARDLDIERAPEPLALPPDLLRDLHRFFGHGRSPWPTTEEERAANRRRSWRRYYRKVARTPAYRARRAAYMREYRVRNTATAR